MEVEEAVDAAVVEKPKPRTCGALRAELVRSLRDRARLICELAGMPNIPNLLYMFPQLRDLEALHLASTHTPLRAEWPFAGSSVGKPPQKRMASSADPYW